MSACSTRLPVKGVNAFYNNDYAIAQKIFEEKSKDDNDKDVVIYRLALLSTTMAAGNYTEAERAATEAMRVMWSNAGTGRGEASLVSAEAIKIFKGEPFEKAMAAIYLGIIYYNRGEYDNARAAFGKALLAIRQKEEKHREDFALPYILQAKAMLKLGDVENAKISLERAQKSEPGNPFLSVEKLKSANALFLAEVGRAPIKFRTGPGDSIADWKRSRYPERLAYIYIDDKEVGRSAEAGDLTQQAQTKGRTGKDAIQVTKGVTREAAAITTVIAADAAARGNKNAGWVALGAGLFALANQSQADIRQWELLPDRIHMILGNIPEGEHTFNIAFYDEMGRTLPQYNQVWYHIPVKKNDDRIYLFRSTPFYKGPS